MSQHPPLSSLARLEHRELSIEELGASMRDSALAEARASGAIQCWWTELADLKSIILNIVSPSGTVFWNFWPYRSVLLGSQIAHQAVFLHPERRRSTYSALSAHIRRAGYRKRSDFGHLALGNWTCAPEFAPDDEPALLASLGGRHVSLVLPAHKRGSLREHLAAQADCFGETCLADFDESLGGGDFEDLRETPAGRLMYAPLAKTSDEQLQLLLDEAACLTDELSIDRYAAKLDLRFGMRGLFSLFPDVGRKRKVSVDALLILRAKLAARVCRLPALENIAAYVGKPMFDAHDEPLRSTLLDILSAPLQPTEQLRSYS